MAVKAKAPKKQEDESKINDFISQGGSHPEKVGESEDDHRLTVRLPKWLLYKLDQKRKQRTGTISRNQWIIEQIENGVES